MGLYECDLNPALGLPIAGYLELKAGTGFYDRLYVRAVSLNSSESKFVFASIDSCGVGKSMCEEVAGEMETHYGVPRENVLVMATHSHSAPDTMAWTPRMWAAPDKEREVASYVERMKEAILWSMSQAMAQESPIDSIIYSTTLTPGLFTNRHDAKGSVDNQTSALLIRGKKSLLLVNHNYHPSVLGANNYCYSADFPAYLTSTVRCELGNVQVNCITGACGDVSARFPLGDEFSPRRNIRSTMKYGDQLGRRILHGMKSARRLKDFTLKSIRKPLRLNLKSRPNKEEALARKEELESKIKQAKTPRERKLYNFQLEGIEMWLNILTLSNGSLPASMDLEVGCVQLGAKGFALAYAPAEIYSTTSLRLKKQSSFKLTMLSGYSNGIVGYIPPPEAYKDQHYEALSTPVTSDAINKLEGVLFPLVEEH
jgi:hypothetical protein